MRVRTWPSISGRSVLALCAAGCVISLVACGSREPTTDAERLARGRELVQRMSDLLAAAPAITVTTSEVRDVVRLSGAKETLPVTSVYTMRRPDRFHAKMTGGRGLEAWYNGKTVTIAGHPDKVFAQAPMPDTLDRTLDALAERYDMPLPMGDFFYGSAAHALLSNTATGGYAGTETIDGTPCTHLSFQDVGVDWELWLPVDGDPLPRRFKVVQKSRVGRPVVDVRFTKWDFASSPSDETFKPKVPADYEGIAILQRAAAVKQTGDAAPTGTAPRK